MSAPRHAVRTPAPGPGDPPPAGRPLLEVEGLTVAFPGDREEVRVVRDVGFRLDRGQMVGLVGESGSGKSMTALALLRLVPAPGRIVAGRVRLGDDELLSLPRRHLREVRGGRIAMIFQEPMTALNPVLTVGFQVAEAVRLHADGSRRAARREALRLLDLVAIPDAAGRLDDYPHQLSGGQRQRVMIAMALAGRPEVLIADEPTTALDVTIQAQILELLARLREELSLTVLLITHDLAVVAESCSRVLVMYAGEIAEEASVEELFARPRHPYTRGLLDSMPRLGQPPADGRLPAIAGRVPEPSALPPGCPFHPRCPEVFDRCRVEPPPLYRLGDGRTARCFLHAPEEDGGEAGR